MSEKFIDPATPDQFPFITKLRRKIKKIISGCDDTSSHTSSNTLDILLLLLQVLAFFPSPLFLVELKVNKNSTTLQR